MHSKRKRGICSTALIVVMLSSMLCGLPFGSGIQEVYAASSGGQTASTDILNVKLTSDGQSTAEASMGTLSEGTYTATNNTIGSQAGKITLDNTSVGGRMHVNIGQTIDMYAPSADVDYADKIGYSGNYTFIAIGGKGGNLTAYDYYANKGSYADGGYGSAVTYNSIDYNTGQSITYRKGSNGQNVTNATNYSAWNWNTHTNIINIKPMGNYNGGLYGYAANARTAYVATAQVGTASYIQVSGNTYIVAGGGAPGIVLFNADRYAGYSATGYSGMHADQTPTMPSGYGFYNPGSPDMSKRYRDFNGTSYINAGRIAGTAVKNGCKQYSGFGGGLFYEDMFYGWITNGSTDGLSRPYPGYSGCATRNGSLFTPSSAMSVTLNTSITSSTPTCQLKCNAKYVTVNNPTRKGYTFTGWTCSSGVSVVSNSGSSYKFKVTSSGATITANWKANTYTITFHGNGADGGSTAKQTCFMNKTHTLNANGFTKTGYTFAGWATSSTGDVVYADKASVYNLTTIGNGNVDLYAKWQANQYTVHFDANGGNGSMADITLTYDVPQNLPANAFTKENGYGPSSFMGWNLVADTQDVLYEDQTSVVNLIDQNGGTVTLYAIWDDCPWITAEDLYYTLDQAQNGFITHDELMSHAVAEDREDGSPITSGQDEETGTMFWIPDYQESDFTQFQSEGSVTETYRVQDSAGNIYKKMITVYIVDTTAVAVQPVGTTRFIDEHYYNQPYENGGLEDKSIWKTDPEYVATIQDAFANLRNDTPEQSYHFTHETILEMQDYVDVHGIGNSKEPDALQNFYDRFMAPNRVN